MREYDVIVIGSGFGGSVAACRLAEKGYRVAVLEKGKRYETADLPRSAWDLRRYIWAPKLGLHGIFALSVFKDLVIFHGSGVGGGSLVYANTHLEPLDAFYRDRRWGDLADWREELKPHYRTARRMLGTTKAPRTFASDEALREVLEDRGQGDTFKRHDVGIYFGEPDVSAEDPYFDGAGPPRTGCTFCGSCMVGCRVGAKNTLDKNYLWLAERAGCEVFPETKAIDIKPSGANDGSDGYVVTTTSSTSWFPDRARWRAKKVVLAASVLGTVELLFRCRDTGSLPHISSQLGEYVRTNSESIQGVMAPPRDGVDVSEGIAITSGGFADDKTHIEMFRYGPNADAMSPLSAPHTGGGPLPRQLYFLAAVAKDPLNAARLWFWPFGWSRAFAGVLAMQAEDNAMRLRYRRPWYWPFRKSLTSDWGDREPPPTYMPAANEVTKAVAEKLGGKPGSVLPEVVLNTTTTAHVLGGATIGGGPEDGVIDTQNRVHGYEGLYVVDGAQIPANLGVNPSLTITAMAERAMSFIPPNPARG